MDARNAEYVVASAATGALNAHGEAAAGIYDATPTVNGVSESLQTTVLQ